MKNNRKKLFLLAPLVILCVSINLTAPTNTTTINNILSWPDLLFKIVTKIKDTESIHLRPILSEEEYARATYPVTNTECSYLLEKNQVANDLSSMLEELKQVSNHAVINDYCFFAGSLPLNDRITMTSEYFFSWLEHQLIIRHEDRPNIIQAYRLLRVTILPHSFNWLSLSTESKIRFLQKYNITVCAKEPTAFPNCPICLEYFNSQETTNTLANQKIIIKTPCNHFFHEICILEAMGRNPYCPCCRSPLFPLINQ